MDAVDKQIRAVHSESCETVLGTAPVPCKKYPSNDSLDAGSARPDLSIRLYRKSPPHNTDSGVTRVLLPR